MKKLNLQQILESNRFLRNKRIGLAVSGGVDSMVMLHLFNKLKKTLNLSLYILHYNHKWRKNSFIDFNLVRNDCTKNNVQLLYNETKGRVIRKEEVARKERYNFFKEISTRYNLDFVCTAHHKDDQIETILFRLLRGTGPAGIIPIKTFLSLTDNVEIYRPLLDFTKEQIYKYSKNHKVKFVHDVTNEEIKYKRNLIRKNVIPSLSKINKNFGNNLLRFCNLVYSNYTTVNNYFPLLLKLLSCKKETKQFSLPLILDRNRFLLLDKESQKIFLYWLLMIFDVKGSISKVERLLKVLEEEKSYDLNKNIYLKADKNNISFLEKRVINLENTKDNRSYDLALNGNKNEIMLGNNLLEIKPFNKEPFKGKFPKDKSKIAYVDLSKFKRKTLSVRYRSPKDVFCPLGSTYAVKLKNYLINKKIPQKKRYNIPLLCFNNKVLWIPGYSLSEDLKVIRKPTHILELKQKNCK